MPKQSKNQSKKNTKKKSSAKSAAGYSEKPIPMAKSIAWRGPTPRGHMETGVEKFASITGAEYLTPGTRIVDKVMSPGMPELPRLAAFCPLYSRYSIKSLAFEIINYAPASATGEYAIVYEPDSQVTWSTMTADQVQARVFASAHKLILNVAPGRHKFVVPVDHSKKYDFRPSDQEDRLSTFGRVLLVNLSAISSNNLLATIHCSYTVAFSEPTVPSAGASASWNQSFASFWDDTLQQATNFCKQAGSDFIDLVLNQGIRYLSAGLESAIRHALAAEDDLQPGQYRLRRLVDDCKVTTRNMFIFGPGTWTIEAGIQSTQDGVLSGRYYPNVTQSNVRIGPLIEVVGDAGPIQQYQLFARPLVNCVSGQPAYGYCDSFQRLNFIVPDGQTAAATITCFASFDSLAGVTAYKAGGIGSKLHAFINVRSHDMGLQLGNITALRETETGYGLMPSGYLMSKSVGLGSGYRTSSFPSLAQDPDKVVTTTSAAAREREPEWTHVSSPPSISVRK